jgi:hypothetical protein
VALYGLSAIAGSEQVENHGTGSLRIVRLGAALYDRTNFRARAWWTLKTNLALVSRAMRDMRNCREILFTGSPPFMLHVVAPLNIFLRKRLVYRISDFFPECMLLEYKKVPLVLRALYRLTQFWRRRIAQFEVLGEDQRRRLLESGIAPGRIVLRRDSSPVSIGRGTAPLRRPAELAGYRILLYSGNFGVAHDYETFLGGYRRHHRSGEGRLALWLNAIGRGADVLESALKEEGLPHFRTRPVPMEQLASLLVTPDAHLITLREPFWGYVLPSKVYGCLASGRPILFVGPKASDVHALCCEAHDARAYFHAGTGDPGAVLQALESLGSASANDGV